MVQTRSKRQSVAKVLEVKADKPEDNNEVTVPDAILNFNRVSASKRKEVDPEVKQARNNSNLLITVNPNISINSLTTDDRKAVYIALKSAGDNLPKVLDTQHLVKPRGLPQVGFKAPPVAKYQSSVEIGNERGFYISIY